jgi:chemotaxis methyl-accepting protein methylase
VRGATRNGGGEEPFAAIQRHLLERQGVDLSRYKATYLRRRLLVRVRALRLPGLEAYARHLREHPEEAGPLFRALSIRVTGFFRNRSCFEFLEESVVPDLVRRAQASRRPVSVWSAGCASGEETFSLAALFASAIPPRADRLVRILGTDLDERALETARRAVYPGRALSEAVPRRAAAQFDARPDGTVSPSPRLRAMVRFERESLLDPIERREVDLLLCRNVLIYFSLQHQEDILDRFASCLADGGHLVLGRVERMFGPARARFDVVSARDRVYRKIPAGAGGRAASVGGAACA